MIQPPTPPSLLDRLDQYVSTVAILVCIFVIAVDPPEIPGWLKWAWKGIGAAAAYYKGLHTDKPLKL